MDEQLKQRALISVWIFALVVTIFQVAFNSGVGFSYAYMALGLLLGLVAGGITFGIMAAMNK